MRTYFLRRLLMVPVTFLAITFMVYSVLRIVPGGPIEQAEAARRLAGGETGQGAQGDLMLDEEALGELQRYYALDEPIPIGYLQWLGVLPREVRVRVPASTRQKHDFSPLTKLHERRQKLEEELQKALPEGYIAKNDLVYRPLMKDEEPPEGAAELAGKGFGKRDDLEALLERYDMTYDGEKYYRALMKPPVEAERLLDALKKAREKAPGFEVTADGTIYRLEERWSGILQGDFGRSYARGEPVLSVIGSKLPISLWFGLVGYLLTWLICVPLGILKAVYHRTPFDTLTSLLVFLGYSMPGFVVCMVLLTTMGAAGWLPLGGFPSEAPFLEKVRHMIIPLAGYMVGSFATMTILMKNSLLENLSADYVRTALAKGLAEKRVILVHALRNSLIPLTANIGSAVGILFAGSFLIEKTTNLDGMGLLGYEAILQRDYPIIMGILVFGVLIQLLGAILSDLIWAALDPRIRYGGEA